MQTEITDIIYGVSKEKKTSKNQEDEKKRRQLQKNQEDEKKQRQLQEINEDAVIPGSRRKQ